MTKKRARKSPPPAERTVRASVSFPEDQYIELERIAKNQRVSLAWVVREAVQAYLVQRWPLLAQPNNTVQHNETV